MVNYRGPQNRSVVKTGAAFSVVGVWVLFWVVFLGLKIWAIPVAIINAGWFFQALSAGTLHAFNPFWLVVSSLVFLLL